MEQIQEGAAAGHPLWRRIIDFPLIALLVAAALFIIANACGILIARTLPPMDSTARLALTSAIDIALVLAAYKLLVAHLGERPRDDLRLEGAPRSLGLGLAIGFVLISAVVGGAWVAGVYRIVGIGDTSNLLTTLIAMAIVPAFMEEVAFRGILFRWLEEFGGTWAGLIISSALFGLAHILNPSATWFSSFAIAMEAGLLFGGAYMLTRSLWAPIGVHAAWNFTQGEIFDVPVSGLDENGLVQAKLSGPDILSGGQFGLEASAIALVIATAAGVWLVLLAIRRGQLVRPWWVRRRLLRAN